VALVVDLIVEEIFLEVKANRDGLHHIHVEVMTDLKKKHYSLLRLDYDDETHLIEIQYALFE
jgi:hypothetical protein